MMKRAAVLGSPISHSLSPLVHNHAYSLLEYPAIYEAIEVKSGELSEFLTRELASSEVLGFSLTMPLKEELAQLSTPALQTGKYPQLMLMDLNSFSKSSHSQRYRYLEQEGRQERPSHHLVIEM